MLYEVITETDVEYTSDANGDVDITGLNPGEYTVMEDLTGTGREASTATSWTITVGSGQEFVAYEGQAGLSDDDIAAGKTEIVLDAQEEGQDGFGVPDLAVGNYLDGSIHLFKYDDFNADGVYDPLDGDSALEGIKFLLTGDINGDVDITGLNPGEYTITEVSYNFV